MNKCDNCIHKEVCKNYPNEGVPPITRNRMLEQGCDHFADIGEMIKLPCEVGDTILQIRYDKKTGYNIFSDEINRIVLNKNGATIYTRKTFYPIKLSEYTVLPINQYPYGLADYWIGSVEDAQAKLMEGEK